MLDDRRAEYQMIRTDDNVRLSYFVLFVKDGDGVWRLKFSQGGEPMTGCERVFLSGLVVLLGTACAGHLVYASGPYQGKVVDAETASWDWMSRMAAR